MPSLRIVKSGRFMPILGAFCPGLGLWGWPDARIGWEMMHPLRGLDHLPDAIHLIRIGAR